MYFVLLLLPSLRLLQKVCDQLYLRVNKATIVIRVHFCFVVMGTLSL